MSDQIETTGNHTAPPGHVYVCTACGKRSRDKYGDQPIDRGWDESCMMNSVMCDETTLVLGEGGRVKGGIASSESAQVLPLVEKAE